MSLTSLSTYKDDLVHQFGGKNQYHIIILSLCNRMKEDKRLKAFFGNFDLASLVALQTEALDWAFGEYNTSADRESAERRLALHHYRLIEDGLSGYHLAIISEHFTGALRECWIDEDLLQIAVHHLGALEAVYGKMPGQIVPRPQNKRPSSPKSVLVAAPKAQNGPVRGKLSRRTSSAKHRIAAMFQSIKNNHEQTKAM